MTEKIHLSSRPANKKNNLEVKAAGKRRFIGPNELAKSSQDAVARSARAQASGMIPIGHDVELRITIATDGQTLVEVRDLGRFEGRPRERAFDVIGVAETIQDALESVVYDNDKQVRRLVVERLTDQKEQQ